MNIQASHSQCVVL